MTTETLICDECGEETDENMAESLLGEAGIDTEGQTLCECCAEEALDATRSAYADAFEMGLYFAEVCRADDVGDDFPVHDGRDVMEDVPEIPEVRSSCPLFGPEGGVTMNHDDFLKAIAAVSRAVVTVARYTCDGETFTAEQYAEDNEEPLDPRILALKVGENVEIDHGAGGMVTFERIADATLTKFTIEIEVMGDAGEAQDVIEEALDGGALQDEINEGRGEYDLKVTSALLVGVTPLTAAPEETPNNDARDTRLASEMDGKTYNGWTFDYLFPGNFSFIRGRDQLTVFFTPDWDEEGKLCFQAATEDGRDVDVPELDETYPEPLTADFLFEAAKKLMDHFDGLVQTAEVAS